MARVSDRLPVFPWDRLEPVQGRGARPPGRLVDLSVGTPVDPVPAVVRQALDAAADSPGYPRPYGTGRAARGDRRLAGAAARCGRRGARRRAAADRLQGAGRLAADPARPGRRRPGGLPARWPTRRTRSARGSPAREPVTYDDPVADLDPARVKLLWLNTPSNPTGRVLGRGRAAPDRRLGARARDPGGLATSATSSWAGRPSRSPCCTRTSAAAGTTGWSPCTRCPSAPTSPGTGARSWPATRPWCGNCSRSASTAA